MTNSKKLKASREWKKRNRDYHLAYMQEWRKRNPEYTIRMRIKRYELTLQEYNTFVEVQNNKCAICNEEFIKAPCIDHDHKIGRVRGLLCGMCNKMIGFARESDMTLQSAINYLKRHNEDI